MNYKTHLNSGIILGFITAFILTFFKLVDEITSIYCILAVISGSILPDFDSDTSRSFNAIMTFVALLTTFALIMIIKDYRFFPIYILIFVFFKTGISEVIKKITKHRGIIHSLGALFLCVLSSYLFFKKLDILGDIYISISIGVGFLSHLILDEINSLIDFKNKKFKIKKSFLTACKIVSFNWSGFICICILFIEMIYILIPYTGLRW